MMKKYVRSGWYTVVSTALNMKVGGGAWKRSILLGSNAGKNRRYWGQCPDAVQVVGEEHPGDDGKRMVGLDSQIRFLEDVSGVGMSTRACGER